MVQIEEVILSYTKPVSPVHNHNNIILLLMIKNEEKIIERCLLNALSFVDAISILDTGSTDNTLQVCRDVLSACNKPYKINIENFKNFGYNRSVSFKKAVDFCNELNWDPENTYALAIDADMNIVVSDTFKTFHMTSNGYKLIQSNGNLRYFNTRFMKCSYPWECIGSTHEYWSGDPTLNIPKEIFYIDDKNDGGCKSDKFERDVRLLTEELNENPNNPRVNFYLAQSFKDLGQYEKSISQYKKRIELGGWHEEVWYSHYQIAKCYQSLNDIEQMEFWANKAFNFNPNRSEPLYYLTRYFREVSQHHKAYHYYLKGRNIPYPKNDILFIEDSVYNGLFDYENTILSFYIHNKSPQNLLLDVVSYINQNIPYFIDNVWNNMHYYIKPLTDNIYNGVYTKFNLSQIDGYNASSCCVIPYTKDLYLMNIRHVNYLINYKGLPWYIISNDQIVRTMNSMVFLNSDYTPIGQNIVVKENLPQVYPSNIEGIEDLRFFKYRNEGDDCGKIYFSASAKNLTPTGNIMIVIGEYYPEEKTISNIRVISPPRPTSCEKNWIAIPQKSLQNTSGANKMNFIYNWSPLEIGAVNENNQLVIHTTYDTPTIFSRFRGSSPLFEFEEKLWCVVHHVRYSWPRIYSHSLVQLNLQTLKPEHYSLPFCFLKNNAIEYCIGFTVDDDYFNLFFSENDSNPAFIKVPRYNIQFIKV